MSMADPALANKERSFRYQTKKRERDLTKTLLIICTAYVVW